MKRGNSRNPPYFSGRNVEVIPMTIPKVKVKNRAKKFNKNELNNAGFTNLSTLMLWIREIPKSNLTAPEIQLIYEFIILLSCLIIFEAEIFNLKLFELFTKVSPPDL